MGLIYGAKTENGLKFQTGCFERVIKTNFNLSFVKYFQKHKCLTAGPPRGWDAEKLTANNFIQTINDYRQFFI